MRPPLEYLICYDIAHPRRLQRVHRLVRSYARMLQKSVYYFRGSAEERDELVAALRQRIRPSEDDIRLYPLARRQPIRWLGKAPCPEGILDFDMPGIVPLDSA